MQKRTLLLCLPAKYQVISQDEVFGYAQETSPQVLPTFSYSELSYCCCETDSFEQAVQLMQDVFSYLHKLFGISGLLMRMWWCLRDRRSSLTEDVIELAPWSLPHSWTVYKPAIAMWGVSKKNIYFLGNTTQFLAVFHTAVIYIATWDKNSRLWKLYQSYGKRLKVNLL